MYIKIIKRNVLVQVHIWTYGRKKQTRSRLFHTNGLGRNFFVMLSILME